MNYNANFTFMPVHGSKDPTQKYNDQMLSLCSLSTSHKIPKNKEQDHYKLKY